MEMRLEIPKGSEMQVREELTRRNIDYIEQATRSAGPPAVFVIASTALQDVAALIAVLQVAVVEVRGWRTRSAPPKGLETILRGTDIGHATFTFPDGTRVDLEEVGDLELRQKLTE